MAYLSSCLGIHSFVQICCRHTYFQLTAIPLSDHGRISVIQNLTPTGWFLAWLQTCFVAVDSSGNHWTVSDLTYCPLDLIFASKSSALPTLLPCSASCPPREQPDLAASWHSHALLCQLGHLRKYWNTWKKMY